MSSYFQLFRLPEQFSLDNDTLEQRYRSLATQFHPDKFAAASAFEQKQAVMMSATINQAYRVLRHPIDRAAYLLQQKNIQPDDPHNTHVASEFLMQQMTWRETLAEAIFTHDITTLTRLQNELNHAQQQLYQQLQTAFDMHDDARAAESVRQGRFLDKMQSDIANALD